MKYFLIYDEIFSNLAEDILPQEPAVCGEPGVRMWRLLEVRSDSLLVSLTLEMIWSWTRSVLIFLLLSSTMSRTMPILLNTSPL